MQNFSNQNHRYLIILTNLIHCFMNIVCCVKTEEFPKIEGFEYCHFAFIVINFVVFDFARVL